MSVAQSDQLVREGYVVGNPNAQVDSLVREAWVALCTQPPAKGSVNYLKSFRQDNGTLLALALDSTGILWEEDVINNPHVLDSIAKNILPNSYAQSSTQENEEWIAFSNSQAGTDIPRHGSNLDRISQVGPGAGPSIIGSAAGTNVYPVVASPNGFTQSAAAADPGDPGHWQGVNWSSGPFNTSPGNVLTLFYSNETVFGAPDPNIVVGGAVYLNMTSGPFNTLTGTYIVTGVGQGFPPHGSGAPRWYFTVQVGSVGNTFVGGPDTATGTYQVTLATMHTTVPAAINVGDHVTVSGATGASWDGVWTILATLNGAQIAITSTSLTSNIATYNYTLVSGVAPAVNDQVTVTGCTNGPIVNGTSIFNVVNTQVSTAGAGTFTVVLNGPNVTTASESGNGIVSGTIFQFDPGLSNLGLGVNAIFGNSGGGTVSTTGQLGSGVREAVTIFITRNGAYTAPSPPVVFETSGSTNILQVSQIALGPPNVIGRAVAFTGANGGNFFYIPNPVTIQGQGQPTTYTSTVINDNVTTQATFRFTDAVLLAATAIDIEGNNLFEQVELGSPAWTIAYADRMFYGLENNKIQNLLNPTFDGGYLPNTNGISSPLGWTVDPVNGGGGQVVVSPIFGNSYQITNSTGSTQAILGLITQSAYQDFYQVPIILPNFTYNIRVNALSVSGGAGNLVIDLFSPTLNRVYGSCAIPFTAMTSAIQIFNQSLLGTAFATQVPPDLILRLYATAIPNNSTVLVDRFDIYPTNQPILTTELQGSYVRNLEAFDGITGPLGVGSQNNQPALGAFVNYDVLYVLKTNSMVSTQDSPGNEPASWKVREVSNKVGTCGINAYDYGEEWAVTAHRSGLYIFNGSEPVKISQEIQPLWDAINWTYGYTIWVKNDTANRKILIGVPLPTPNQWLPNAAAATPTSPNVILMLNYKDLNTSEELAIRGPIKIAFSGKLISWDISRKWSIWQIPTNSAAFITRSNTSQPLYLGSSTGSQIYSQVPGLLSDDFGTINYKYDTYGFVKAEQEGQYGPILGDHRKLFKYLELNLEGFQNNVERPLQVEASRLYLEFSGSSASGLLNIRGLQNVLNATYPVTVPGGVTLPGQFQLSEAKLTVTKSPSAPVRGV